MEKADDPIVRAFELARSGKFNNVTEIKAQLRAENYGLTTISGSSLSKQLRGLIQEAKKHT